MGLGPADVHELMSAFLNRVGLAVPDHDVHDTFIRFGATLLRDDRDRALFVRMAGRSGIAHRFSTLAPGPDPASGPSIDRDGFYTRGRFPSSGARMRAYEEAARPLATRAVADLALSASERAGITHLIVTSCTGFYAPGLDLDLAHALRLRGDVERTTVGFMGCQAAFNALKLARHIVRSEREARVLLVNIELCTLHLQQSDALEQVLSFLVFADGCAASLVSADPHGLSLDRFHAAVVAPEEGLITWRIGDQGFDMFLSGRVPGAIADGLRKGRRAILDGVETDAIDLWAVHPGGRSVLDAVETSLDLPAGALVHSRAVLSAFGNMSSATIMFVLSRILAAGAARGRSGCALGFGPGLTAETLLFRTA